MIFNLFRINTAWLLVSIGILLIASERFTACLQLEELSPGECLTLSLRFNFPYWLRHAVYYSSTVHFVRNGTDEWLSESNAWHNSDMPCVDGVQKDCLPTNSDWLSRFKIHHISHHPIRLNSIHATLFCLSCCRCVCSSVPSNITFTSPFWKNVIWICRDILEKWRGWLTLRWNCEISRITFNGKVSLTVRSWCQPSCTPACICCFSSLDFTFLSSLTSIMFVSLAINLNPIELGRDIAHTRQSSAAYRHRICCCQVLRKRKIIVQLFCTHRLVWDVGVWWRVKEFMPWCLTWEFTFNTFFYFPRLTQHFEHKFVLFMRFPLVCFSSPAPSPLTLCCC